MTFKPHNGKRLHVRWYAHRVTHHDGVYDVLRADRVKGRVGRVSYQLQAHDGVVVLASSDDIHACRII